MIPLEFVFLRAALALALLGAGAAGPLVLPGPRDEAPACRVDVAPRQSATAGGGVSAAAAAVAPGRVRAAAGTARWPR